MNSSFAYSSAFAVPPYGGPPVGFLNGSGQPQKFVDGQGRVLDIYQFGAQVCDEMLKPQYLGAGTDVVIRALPSAATAPYVELRDDVTRSLSRVRA